MQPPGPQASSARALALPCSFPWGSQLLAWDPLSITTPPRLLTPAPDPRYTFLSPTRSSCSLDPPPVAPHHSRLKACHSSTTLHAAVPLRLPTGVPNPASASVQPGQLCQAGAGLEQTERPYAPAADQPLDLAAWGAWPLQPGSALPTRPPVLTASPRDYSGFPVLPLCPRHTGSKCAKSGTAWGQITESCPWSFDRECPRLSLLGGFSSMRHRSGGTKGPSWRVSAGCPYCGTPHLASAKPQM